MLASDRPDLVSAVIMLAAGGKVPPTARNLGRHCVPAFVLFLPQKTRMEFVQSAFFAAGNDPSMWRDGWEPAVAQMQVRASEATSVERWWGAGEARLLVVQGLQDRLAVPENGRHCNWKCGRGWSWSRSTGQAMLCCQSARKRSQPPFSVS